MPTAELISILKTPGLVVNLPVAQWNGILVQARKNQLLGQLAALLVRQEMLRHVPVEVARHLKLELLTAQRRGESALWELDTLRQAIDSSVPLVVLKGCAYVAAGDINHAGRSFSDVDVMVQRQSLRAVEGDLLSAGWMPSSVDAYDAAYYRNWMHEVPPMEHIRRRTVLDLHHAINPPVAAYYVNPARLMATSVALSPGLFVLSPVDRVVHCAIHLIQEGESKKLLRDLYDLQLLVKQHCANDEGDGALLARSQELGVKRLVVAAASAAKQLFDQKNSQLSFSWLRACLVIAAQNAHETRSIRGYLAGTALLMYSHWIKMPLKLLVPHLFRKGLKAIFSRETNKHEVKSA